MCGADTNPLCSAVVVDADTDCTCLTPQRARSFPTQHNHDTLVSRGSFCSILVLLRDVQRDLSVKVCVDGRESLERCLSGVLSDPGHLCDCPPGRATLSRLTFCPPGCPLKQLGDRGLTLGEQKAEAGGRATESFTPGGISWTVARNLLDLGGFIGL